mgnify:CR=1 FL=1
MKLSDYKGTDGIDLLADLLDPLSVILTDEEFRVAISKETKRLKIVQLLLKTHKKEILEILALIDQEDPETYNPSIFVLPMKLMDILSMPEINMLFMSQGQNEKSESSGPATESTEGAEE